MDSHTVMNFYPCHVHIYHDAPKWGQNTTLRTFNMLKSAQFSGNGVEVPVSYLGPQKRCIMENAFMVYNENKVCCTQDL